MEVMGHVRGQVGEEETWGGQLMEEEGLRSHITI